jgi:hypothetical protein
MLCGTRSYGVVIRSNRRFDMTTTINERASAPWKIKLPAQAGRDTGSNRLRAPSTIFPFCILIALALALAFVGALFTQPPEIVLPTLVGP